MNIFNTLVARYKDAKQKSINKKEFRHELLAAVADGKLTPEEVAQLDSKKQILGLTDEDIKQYKADAYSAAFQAAKTDTTITADEEQELNKIQNYLGITDSDVAPSKKELTHLRLLNEIQKGNLPTTTAPNLVTVKDEKIYWVEPATLVEEKVISRGYVGGSRGVSVRIVKGVYYRVGQSRGQLISTTGIVSVGTGELVITNKRVLFRGNGKSFVIKYDKLLDLQIFTNALYLSEPNKAKPRMIKFSQLGNHDVIGAILSYAINNYSSKAAV